MKKTLLFMAIPMLALLLAGCSNNGEDNAEDAVMVILKKKDPKGVGYWDQVASAIDKECAIKGVKAVIRYTGSDADYQSQINAIDEMKKLNYRFKGIVAVPIYSKGQHEVEESILEVAEESNIPIVIIDTPVSEDESPLKGKYRAYVGTDNEAAGRLLAQKVNATSDNILSACSKASNAGHLRYKGFCSVKEETALWEATEDEAINIVQKLKDFPNVTDIVYFNGSLSGNEEVLNSLEKDNKSVYTFDVFESTLQKLINGNVIKGILAQQTFEMGKEAVDALFNSHVESPIYITPIYITKDNLESDDVKPFLDFFK